MEKPKVGQTVYSLNVGNAARNTKQKLTPVTVCKVGRKYFYAKRYNWPENTAIKYDLLTWGEVTDYFVNNKLFESVEAYEISKERGDLIRKLESVFRHGIADRLLLSQLREIIEVIKRHD